MDKLSYSNKYKKMKHKYLQLKKLKELSGGDPLSYADITKLLGNSKLIGKGANGCVFSPPLKCDHSNCTDSKCLTGISKLMNYGKAELEINMYKILNIDDIDKEMIFHIGAPHLCIPNIQNVPRMCSFITKPLGLLIYENGGENAYNILDIINNQPDPLKNNNFKVFFINLKHILLGLKLFHNNRISHFDIKLDNIVTGLNKDFNRINNINFRLIDFGLSLNYNCELNSSNIFNGHNGMYYDSFKTYFNENGVIFSYYPVDFYLVSFFDKKKLNEDGLEELKKYISAYTKDILEVYKSYNYIVNTYSKDEFTSDNIYLELVKLLNRPFDKIILRIIQTVESFQFGLLLLDLLCYFPQYKKQIEVFLDKTKLLHFNPFERTPIGQLYEEFINLK
jgi:serine/threonine protein kinase